MANFTPISAAIGGALIGLAAVLLMRFDGRIAGVTGIGTHSHSEVPGQVSELIPGRA